MFSRRGVSFTGAQKQGSAAGRRFDESVKSFFNGKRSFVPSGAPMLVQGAHGRHRQRSSGSRLAPA